MTNNPKNNDLTEAILQVVSEKKPQSVRELTAIMKQTLNCQEDEILKSVLKLQAQGAIRLENPNQNPRNLTGFATGEPLWYFLIIAAATITASIVFLVPENFYPWIYIRNFLGVIFVLFLPGYALLRVLFPVNLPGRTSTDSYETIERILLSIGISIALVSIVGLLLYYSPWKVDLAATVLSLYAITIIFATAGFAREKQASKRI